VFWHLDIVNVAAALTATPGGQLACKLWDCMKRDYMGFFFYPIPPSFLLLAAVLPANNRTSLAPRIWPSIQGCEPFSHLAVTDPTDGTLQPRDFNMLASLFARER
jgi:hypothetical protein